MEDFELRVGNIIRRKAAEMTSRPKNVTEKSHVLGNYLENKETKFIKS